tara:strand:- start:205 stop:384 length:180 start_codon:yes stop_codon:yes gene_type:complete
MDNVVDLIATDSSAADTTEKIKDMLYTKASDKIEKIRSSVANSMFDGEVEPEEESQEDG